MPDNIWNPKSCHIGVWRVNEIASSCSSEEIQEHPSDQTIPLALLQQVFLITKCHLLNIWPDWLCSWAYCFVVSILTLILTGTRNQEKIGAPPILSVGSIFPSLSVFEQELDFYKSPSSPALPHLWPRFSAFSVLSSDRAPKMHFSFKYAAWRQLVLRWHLGDYILVIYLFQETNHCDQFWSPL